MDDFPKLSNAITRCACLIFMLLTMSACTLDDPVEASSAPDGWTDANTVMAGICFESAFDAAGTAFVLRDDTALSNFFDLADNSQLCRRPVERVTFDFSDGRVLAGLWSYGTGCTAQHRVTGFERDDLNQTLTITLDFITEGDCPYELIRPFWIGLDGATGYDITFHVE